MLDNKRTGDNVPTYKLVNDKVSTYNKDVYVDKCYMCSSVEKLETHHLIHQKILMKLLMVSFTKINCIYKRSQVKLGSAVSEMS